MEYLKGHYRKKLCHLYSAPRDPKQTNPTTPFLGSGIAGIVNMGRPYISTGLFSLLRGQRQTDSKATISEDSYATGIDMPHQVSWPIPTVRRMQTVQTIWGGLPPRSTCKTIKTGKGDSRILPILPGRQALPSNHPSQLRKKDRTPQSNWDRALYCNHRVVTSSSIARWVKAQLETAGINTSIFSAHSTRAALTLVASNMGITTNDILKPADWSLESVFQKFYYKPSEDPSFGRKVLSAWSAMGPR